jgi:hypothetical protein
MIERVDVLKQSLAMGRDISIDGIFMFYVSGTMAHHFLSFHNLHTDQAIPMVLEKLQALSKVFQNKNLSIPVPDELNNNYGYCRSPDGSTPFSEDERNGVAFYLLTEFLSKILANPGKIEVDEM